MKITIPQRILAALQRQYPDWNLHVSNARRKRGTKHVYRYDLSMNPKRGGIGGYDEGRYITLR